MTDREKAIVMAYTGVTMLTGDKCQIFDKYVEEIMGRPIWTHEMAQLADEIKEKSKADFIALCADEGSSENPYKWIPVTEDAPLKGIICLWCNEQGSVFTSAITYRTERISYVGKHGYFHNGLENHGNIVAWMPLPTKPYRESEGNNEI